MDFNFQDTFDIMSRGGEGDPPGVRNAQLLTSLLLPCIADT